MVKMLVQIPPVWWRVMDRGDFRLIPWQDIGVCHSSLWFCCRLLIDNRQLEFTVDYGLIARQLWSLLPIMDWKPISLQDGLGCGEGVLLNTNLTVQIFISSTDKISNIKTCKYSSVLCLYTHLIKGFRPQLKASVDWRSQPTVQGQFRGMEPPTQIHQSDSPTDFVEWVGEPQLRSTRLWSRVYLRTGRGRLGWPGLLCS